MSTEPPTEGRIVIDWVRASDEADPDPRWSWKIRPDPPLNDDELSQLLSEIAARL